MLELRTVGDKVLTQKSKRVANIDDTLRTLCASMVNFMYEKNGIGLAAPQIGVLKRIIVVDCDGKALVLINPEITDFFGTKIILEEGCLSIPETFLKIARPSGIRVKYRDTKGKPHIQEFTGLISRIIQHEIDHLDGILMTDV